MEEVEVHVWQISLARESARVGCFFEFLDEGERSKAARFHFLQDQERFVIARGSLRLILAKYVNEPPDRIRFRYSPNGKPELEMQRLEPRLHFNLSHSSEIGLLAVARGRQVGVDVERITPSAVDDIGIAGHFFTPVEAGLVRSASAETRAAVFFRLWTRKEAFLKGCGDGLSGSLSQFEVSLEHSGIQYADSHSGARKNWSVHEFYPCPGYIAALAIEDALPRLKFLTV